MRLPVNFKTLLHVLNPDQAMSGNISGTAATMTLLKVRVGATPPWKKVLHPCKILQGGLHQEFYLIITSSEGEMRVYLYDSKELYL